jgi:hypothetical protein
MKRILTVAATLVLCANAAHAAGATSLVINGVQPNGEHVAISVTISGGAVNGGGRIYGTNPANGYQYSYPFSVTGVTVQNGGILVKGLIGGANPANAVTLIFTTRVQGGAFGLTITANGHSSTSTGTCQVQMQ